MTRLLVGSGSDVGRVREVNEDSFFVSEPLFVVADGMGGHSAGDVASSTAVDTIRSRWGDGVGPGELPSLVREANAAIWNRAQGDRDLHGMGTTCTLALVDDGTVHLAHVGDSRAYLFRDDALQQLTEDHTLVARMVKEGRLRAEDAEHHPQRSIITRALGVDEDVQVDTHIVDVQEGDRILLCSDGLSGMLPHDRIAALLRDAADPQAAVDALISAANEAGGDDNITAVLIDVVDDATAAAPKREDTERPAPAPAPAAAPVASTPRRRWLKPLIVTLLTIALLAVAAYVAIDMTMDNSFFVGADDEGFVAVYRGIPEDVGPLSLREVERTTQVALADLPEFLRADVREGIKQGSLEEANRTVEELANRARDIEQERKNR